MVVSLVRSTKLGTFAMGKPPRINDSRPSCRRGGCVGKFSHMTCPGIWVGATCLGEHGPMPSIFVVFVLYLMRPMFWLTSRAIASIGVFSRNEYNSTVFCKLGKREYHGELLTVAGTPSSTPQRMPRLLYDATANPTLYWVVLLGPSCRVRGKLLWDSRTERTCKMLSTYLKLHYRCP